jgi:hypothetical protein
MTEDRKMITLKQYSQLIHVFSDIGKTPAWDDLEPAPPKHEDWSPRCFGEGHPCFSDCDGPIKCPWKKECFEEAKRDENLTKKMISVMSESIKRYPKCRVANCDCDSKNDKWENGCSCLCHLDWVRKHYGEDYTWEQFEEEVKKHGK